MSELLAHDGERPAISVRIRGLVFIYRLEEYDVVALSGVDLDIDAGQWVALVGPSGSGKSTLLSLIGGLLRPSAGRLYVGDRDLVKATAAEVQRMRAVDVGMVMQHSQHNLVPYLSAEQNVRFAQVGGRANGIARLPHPRDLLRLVGLGKDRLRRRPDDLNPADRQRLALAVGMANRPGLLLADEPTSQLDDDARDEVLDAVGAIARAGTTVVVVTHDPDVGQRMGRMVTMRDGRVGGEGRSGEDYAIVGRDGSVHLPEEALDVAPPGSLLRVSVTADGTVHLSQTGQRLRSEDTAGGSP